MVTVSTTAALLAALKSAAAGAVIALAPGIYTPVISNFHGSATIMSLNASNPARFTSLMVSDSSGLIFKNLEFDASSTPVGPWGAAPTIPFQVKGSSQMTFANLNVHGSPMGTLATDVSGLLIRDGANIQVVNSDFHNLHNGLQHLNLTGFMVSGNHFHHLRDDGLRGGGSSFVTVQNNACDSNHPDGAADQDHPDCIQFWTSNTTTTAHDIIIVGNTYTRGTGMPTQGIFVHDETGKLPFLRVTIANNAIKDALWNAISVNGATNVVISHNLVCQQQGQAAWFVLIDVNTVTMTSNSSPLFMYTNVKGLTQSANLLNQGFCSISTTLNFNPR